MAIFLVRLVLALLATPGAPVSIPGAVANGVSDDTAAIQKAIDVLPEYGVLDGGGGSYLTGTLRLKSRMTMQNFTLKTRASNVPLVAPITLDGRAQPISEVRIKNVHIDGNRKQQTNLATAEDGGRDGFRIVGVARDIWIIDSSAVNCGTDGLKLFSADTAAPPGSLNFTNIYVVNSTFNNNRRHGASADSIKNANFINVTVNGNGLPSSGVVNPTEGESAYLVDGMLYGAGLVVENYTPEGSVDTLSVVSCTATGNARFGIQFWENTSPSADGFVPRSNIRIENSVLDGGVSPDHGHQAIEFNVKPDYLGMGFAYHDVTLADNQITGTVIVNSTDSFRMVGGTVQSPYLGFYGISHASRDVVVQAVASGGKVFDRE